MKATGIRRVYCALVVGSTLLVGMALKPNVAMGRSQVTHHVQTPPDSFLAYKVYTVDGLVKQVQEHPRIRKVYAKHFHVSEDRVAEYIRHNLVESYVPETRSYTVYCVRSDGNIYPVKQTFRRGTKVFALRNGQPVMKWLCGNPLSKFLPAVETKTLVKKETVIKVSPSIETITPAETMDIIVPTEVVTPFYQPAVPVIVGAASVPAIVYTGASAIGAPWWLLPVPLAFTRHPGGGGGGIVPLVPEPSGAVIYLVILVSFAALLIGRTVHRRSVE